MKSFLLYFPSCDSALWGQMNSQSWFKEEFARRLEEPGIEFSVSVRSVYWQHEASFYTHLTKQLNFSLITPQAYCVQDLKALPFSHVLLHTGSLLLGRKLLFQRVHCIASGTAQKREQWNRTQKKTQAPGIGKQLSLKMERQRYY